MQAAAGFLLNHIVDVLKTCSNIGQVGSKTLFAKLYDLYLPDFAPATKMMMTYETSMSVA